MKNLFCLTLVGALAANIATAQFTINTGSGLFDPSFRGLANTTWFGWGNGKFEGATNNELIDNPAPSFGTTTAGVSLTQSTGFDILSSSDNIYTSTLGATDLLLAIPTTGTPAAGFTTLIIQGKTLFGGFGVSPAFGSIAGVSPVYEVGNNAAGSGQFWAKYEIAGNLTSYDLAVTLAAASFTSIGELEVDTYWSATGFSADTAVVPEPSALALVGLGSFAAFALKQRSRKIA